MTKSQPNLWRMILILLGPERGFWWLMLIYGVAISILGLSVPLSVQVLISSVVNVALIDQVLVLSLVLFTVLMLSAFFMAIQYYLMQLFERRYFVRVMSEVTLRLLYAAQESLCNTNRSDLVNRYFDIMTIQKSLPPLVTGGLALALQTIAGIILTSFYHPAILAFNTITIILVYLVFRSFDRSACISAVDLSSAKYDAASWLDEVARSNSFFQCERAINYALRRSKVVCDSYIDHHRHHFHFTFAQAVGFLFIYATASSILLGLGGWLVIKGELMVGQLIAAELVLAVILYNLTRWFYYLELYYDLYAAMSKLLQLLSIQPETIRDCDQVEDWKPSLIFDNVIYSVGRQDLRFDFSLSPGSNTLFVARSSIQEYAFADLIRTYAIPSKGLIRIDGHDISDFNAHLLRNDILVIDATPLPVCSIADYLLIAKPELSRTEMRRFLDIVSLSLNKTSSSDALDEVIMPEGYPLSPVGVLKLKIAFALAASPKILMLTTLCDTLGQEARLCIMQYLRKYTDITVIYFSHRPDLREFDQYIFCDYEGQYSFDSIDKAFEAYDQGFIHN